MGAERTDFECLNRKLEIIDWAGGRGKVPHVMDRDIEEDEFRDILLDELEIWIAAEVGNVVHAAGDEIIDADHLVTTREEKIGQVRAEEAGGAGDDGGGVERHLRSSLRTAVFRVRHILRAL